MGTLVLTAAYQGLVDLAKQFLDPFHNENFWNGGDALVVDTLIAETNSNSVRWMNSLETMPFSTSDIEDGQLDDFVLPEEGYTAEEAAEMEREEMLAKEAQIKEQEQPLYAQQPTPTMTKTETTTAVPDVAVAQEEMERARLEQTEDELEETVAIMNAQPGLDFVPGLDDEGESLAYHKSYGTNSTAIVGDGFASEDMAEELSEQFMEATDGQLKDARGLVDGEATPRFS